MNTNYLLALDILFVALYLWPKSSGKYKEQPEESDDDNQIFINPINQEK